MADLEALAAILDQQQQQRGRAALERLANPAAAKISSEPDAVPVKDVAAEQPAVRGDPFKK